MSGLTVEPLEEHTAEPCACCGHRSRAVWGMIHDPVGPLASYAVHWTPHHTATQGATFDLVLGEWGETSTLDDRIAVSVQMRHGERGASFMVSDAHQRPLSALAARHLAREQVVGTGIGKEVFACLDAIWLQDARIREVTQPPTSARP
ncbi:MAG: hypothetical protein AAFS10_02170 [Myxococcota bacterium]